jgi:hypothetical protein
LLVCNQQVVGSNPTVGFQDNAFEVNVLYLANLIETDLRFFSLSHFCAILNVSFGSLSFCTSAACTPLTSRREGQSGKRHAEMSQESSSYHLAKSDDALSPFSLVAWQAGTHLPR